MSVREQLRAAMIAQGKVDPDEVFAEAEAVDPDAWEPLPDAEQEALDLNDEERYAPEP